MSNPYSQNPYDPQSEPSPGEQNPYGQQPPYGQPYGQQPPSGQNPYEQQAPAGYGPAQQPGGPQQGPPGGGPIPPGGQPPPQQPDMPPPQPQQSTAGKLKKIARFAVPALVVILAVGGWLASRNDPEQAKAGDCVSQSESDKNEIKVADCDSSDAEYKVEKRFDDTTDQYKCAKMKGAEPDWSAYRQEQGSDKFVLCLSPTK